MKKALLILALGVAMVGCDDLFEPAIENNQNFDNFFIDPTFADGILANAYRRIPNGSWSFNDVATDDAVSNDDGNSYRKMAAGTWTSQNNPINCWGDARAAIYNINLFLANCDGVDWAEDEMSSKMFNDRYKGEAYALRAMFMYYLLKNHGGFATDGSLLGVPVVTAPETASDNFNIPRNSFSECMAALRSDVENAIALLPWEYGDAASMEKMRTKYGDTGSRVSRVFGSNFQGRISGRVVEAFEARMELLAASPAYSDASGVTWADAAQSAAVVLNHINGVDGLAPTGHTFYTNIEEIDSIASKMPKEVLWRTASSDSRSLESDNFPPTLYGNGRVNPTQNLVNAFPMLNGYPIDNLNSGYSSADPYANRDPRLAAYILYNGQKAGLNNATITTAADGTDNNALNKVNGHSTRTGYYLRKLLRQDVSLDPSATADRTHYVPYIRYTEIFLSYAEAANEAYGPTGTAPNANYSAYDVIKAIRQRAGIGTEDGDPYLESVKSNKEAMRDLIRNERRIELCFEGHRFYDLRRWKLDLNEPAKGISIRGNIYTEIDVESRNYQSYMYYGPVPYDETLKFSALLQNAGW